uniref:Uncharacterized protein n=1 Tax=Glossina palpalis gambiensis TaxID=67801 RepID=A0A1B0BDP6_9MUSC
MSVKINVNGNFRKCSRSHAILEDPQRVRKEEEKNRRKLRLLQVREKAKNVAQKVRYEVAAEKERQLKNLEEAKAKELDIWRKDMIKQHSQAYCSAIGEIGQAHRAAKKENQKSVCLNANRAPRKIYTNQKKCTCCKESKCISTQTDKVQSEADNDVSKRRKPLKCVCEKAEVAKDNEFAGKRKRTISFSSSSSDSESEIDPKGRFELEITDSSCPDSSSLSSTECVSTAKKSETEKKVSQKIPCTVLDVEIDSNNSIEIVSPHGGLEGQKVIKIRPSRSSKKDKQTVEKRVQAESVSQNSSELTSSTNKKDKKNVDRKAESESAPENSSECISICFSPSKKPALASKKPNEEKRFTLVSNLIKKHQSTNTIVTPELSEKEKSSPSKQSITTYTTSQSHSGIEAPAPSQKTSSISFKNATVPQSRQTFLVSNNGSGSSGRVQFYDYNTKQSKGYLQPAHVTIERQQDRLQPTAMEDAAKEKQLQKDRDEARIKQNKKMEERGQKALDREQVRQDCNELTEKLEALTKQYPRQLPTRDNTEHFFEDKRVRNEAKLNAAVEELLSRPTIITCSEIYKPGPNVLKNSTKSAKLQNELNLGCTPLPADDVSSDSCCSILLDYVEDQSKQLYSDLQKSGQNKEKSTHLKSLLKRLDEFRNCLLRELKDESQISKTSRKDDMRRIVESVTDLLKECYNIPETKTKEKIEKESMEESKKVVLTDPNKALEIVITVKGDEGRQIRHSGKIKKKPAKTPSRLTALVKSPHSKKVIPLKKQRTPLQKQELIRLYDSNSTSYQSLPPEMVTKLDDLMKQQLLDKTHHHKDNEPSTERKATKRSAPPPLNPLTAQYIQRLLAMSHGDIQKLGVNSSEIETPSSSIINTPNNLTSSSDIVSNERLEFIQNFIEDNRSFIKELEHTLDTHNTLPGDASIRLLDDLWRKRLFFKEGQMPTKIKDDKQRHNDWDVENLRHADSIIQDKASKEPHGEKQRHADANIRKKRPQTFDVETRRNMDIDSQKKRLNVVNGQKQSQKTDKRQSRAGQPKSNVIKQRESKKPEKGQEEDQEQETENEEEGDGEEEGEEEDEEGEKEEEGEASVDTLSSESSGKNARRGTVEKLTQTSSTLEKAQKVDKAVETNIAETPVIVEASQRLTENCALRIAELTELINRVREEKQRLLEVTLSSTSETGLQSTEYLELPEGSGSNKRIDLIETEVNLKKDVAKLTPLSKTHAIGDSRDSGIYDSRPATAQGERTDAEPDSRTSPEQHSKQQRKQKPPPTIQRFSPQFAEAEPIHELSTILEVETPATSRINAAQNAVESVNAPQSPSQTTFPTFEQYVKQNNLDLTQLDAAQNAQLHIDFCQYIDKLQKQQIKSPPKYKEFPTAKDYMQHFLDSDSRISQCAISETSTEPEERTDLKTVSPVNFPKSHEYTICTTSESTETKQQLMISKSIGKSSSSNECESINIEEELKKRNILKQPFRSSEKKKAVRTSANPEAEFFADVMPIESGIEKLSTSEQTADSLEDTLMQLLKQWPELIRRNVKENLSFKHMENQPCATMEASQSLNIRDFLTRELLKHAALSSSLSSSSEDSLCNQFLLSIIGSISPRQNVKIDKKTAPRIVEHQVTSTPVEEMRSTNYDSSDISSQIFTGESTISSIRCQQQQRKCSLLSANNKGHAAGDRSSST